MGEVEEQQAENHQAEHEHVACAPAVGSCLAAYLITLYSAACLDVLVCEPASVDDVHEKTEGEHGHHDRHYGKRHEVAAELEQAVSFGEEDVVICNYPILAGKSVDYREKIDGSVQEQEEEKESAAYGLDEFLSDG